MLTRKLDFLQIRIDGDSDKVSALSKWNLNEYAVKS